MLVQTESEIIVIEDSDSDMEVEVDPAEIEIVAEINKEPVDLSINSDLFKEFPPLTSDYQDVLEEINKDLGISNNLIETKSTMLETELRIEEVFSLPAPNLSTQDPQQTHDATMQDFKHKYDKLVDENRNFMNSLKTILECPVCLTMVRSSPVPSCHNGHIVCTSCWNMTHLCPLCRVKLHKTEKCFSQTANTLLQLVTLPCQYEDEGCSFQGKRSQVEQHQQECIFRGFEQDGETLSECPSSGCGVGKQKKEKTSRLSFVRVGTSDPATSSPRRHCDACNKDFSRRYFNRHICAQGAMWRTLNM